MSNMIIKKAIINNFKSIEHIELDFDKVGNSYTKIFVGINESGKSNILEALSYFKVPKTNVSFDSFCNQKLEDSEKCEISFYLELGDNDCSINGITDLNNKPQIIKFRINNIIKRVFLQKKKNIFEFSYEYDVELLDDNIYIRKEKGYDSIYNPIDRYIINNKRAEGFDLLTNGLMMKFFRKIISDMIEKKEPEVSMWKPSPDYILSNINLNKFKENINSSKPLKNIFYLSGYTEGKIKEIIDKVSNHTQRSILSSKLNTAINNYIKRVWSNKISIIIEIADTGNLSFLIKDQGVENEHNRFEITDRSQGAQQFLSLILSLSLEAENHERKNEIILIDEPEVHLHPSGIRDLGKELLKVGNENYVFLATHSPFIIDKQHKERHYIVKKNKKAITEITRIKESDNIIDDEVLNEAFGINVYRDLLNPHSVLVEGVSDKLILQKAFECLGYNSIGIKSFACSMHSEDSRKQITDLLKGKVSAFTGNTGVGKSTLLNSLFPELEITTAEISRKLGRGRHTTRHSELYKINGGYVADTPGFSTVDIERYEMIELEKIQYCFPEFDDYICRCQFTGCSHTVEKGCAVLQAVADGKIAKSRHESYQFMYNEVKAIPKWR